MRLPFPDSVRYSHVFLFALTLCGGMLLMGTGLKFTGLSFCFLMIAALAFNTAGGMYYPSGLYIGCNAIFTVALPLTAKTLMRDPVDSGLRSPLLTMEIYVTSMVAMLVAAVVTKRLRPQKALISDMLPPAKLGLAYVGCVVLATSLALFLTFADLSHANGTLGSFILQVNRFPAMAMLLGTIYTIQKSGGRRSMTWPLFLIITYMSATGLVTYSKEAFLAPIFCWIAAAAYMRYRLSWINIFVLAAATYLSVTYMVPYAGYGRDYDTPLSPTAKSMYLLSHMDEVQAGYEEMHGSNGPVRYYSKPIPLLDRMEVFSVDDALIDVTDRLEPLGYQPVLNAIQNFVPHFLWAGKVGVLWGNVYAHEIGIIGDEDQVTGVSFSPAAEAYHMGRNWGVGALEPLVLALSFLILDSTLGDTRRNPVGLVMSILLMRVAYEGFLSGAITVLAQPLFGVILAAYAAKYLMPILASLVPGIASDPELTRATHTALGRREAIV